ncbi:hypothetical protein MKZ38_006938 [Zalerion maritima]|uniref:Uncharacterized protein n=1 Tax=Zalerion maritima TaxID=339359 RepID=A0AAD5WWP1_9PEZI|nr:hypothetical protein MKZ38_006938 [Zalerion maritima]
MRRVQDCKPHDFQPSALPVEKQVSGSSRGLSPAPRPDYLQVSRPILWRAWDSHLDLACGRDLKLSRSVVENQGAGPPDCKTTDEMEPAAEDMSGWTRARAEGAAAEFGNTPRLGVTQRLGTVLRWRGRWQEVVPRLGAPAWVPLAAVELAIGMRYFRIIDVSLTLPIQPFLRSTSGPAREYAWILAPDGPMALASKSTSFINSPERSMSVVCCFSRPPVRLRMHRVFKFDLLQVYVPEYLSQSLLSGALPQFDTIQNGHSYRFPHLLTVRPLSIFPEQPSHTAAEGVPSSKSFARFEVDKTWPKLLNYQHTPDSSFVADILELVLFSSGSVTLESILAVGGREAFVS